MKSCVFCKADLAVVGRAREHIFPGWLLEAWDGKKNLIEPTHYDGTGKVISQRSHTMNDLVAGAVCAPCNNGWMSLLETSSKDMILDLAAGRRRIIELSHEEALLLARWTAKTAFVLHTSANYRRIIPDEHLYKLDTASYRLPKDVFVVGHTYKRSEAFSWSQGTNWVVHQDERKLTAEENEHIVAAAYKIGIRVGGLYLMIFHLPLPHTLPVLWKWRHVPLYPRESRPVAWSSADHAWPSKPDERFFVFMMELGLRLMPLPADHS